MNGKEEFFTECDESNIPTTVLGFLQANEHKRKSVTRCRTFDSPKETSLQKQFHTKVKDLNTDELRQLLCDVVTVNGDLQDTLQKNNVQLEQQLKVNTDTDEVIIKFCSGYYNAMVYYLPTMLTYSVLGTTTMEKSKKQWLKD